MELNNNILFGQYSVGYTEDDFDNYKRHTLESNPLLSSEPDLNLNEYVRPVSISGTHMLIERFEHDKKSTYSIIIKYKSSEWLFISETDPLQILFTDSSNKTNSLNLPPESSRGSTVLDGGIVFEKMRYEISFEDLQKLATGISGKLKITGKDEYLIRYIYYVNFDYIRKFVNEPFNQSN